MKKEKELELQWCPYKKCFGGYTDFCDECKKDPKIIEIIKSLLTLEV